MKQAPPRALLIWLIVSQALAALSLVPWGFMAGLSVRSSDSGVTRPTIALVAMVWAYPIVPLACSIIAWLLYRRRRARAAGLITAIPLLPAALLWLAFGWVYVAYVTQAISLGQ